MTNSTVNKMISKIQFTIYSFLTFVFSMIIISYALLSYGISIPRIILPGFKAEQLYIKLDKKLNLYVNRIDVTIGNDKDSEDSLSDFPRMSPIINLARKNFESFKIKELRVNDSIVTFSYIENFQSPEDNSFTLTNKELNVSIHYKIPAEHIVFEIKDFTHTSSGATISGKSLHDFEDEMSYTDLNLSFPDSANIKIVAKDSGEEVAFVASSNIFADLKPIVKLFKLKDNIFKWIVPKNQAKEYKLIQAKGIYSFSDKHKINDTLLIHAQEKELSYSFHPQLPSIVSKNTDVYFSKGILDIQPHNASYGEHLIDKGSVSIDFNNKDVHLNIDLYANVRLDEAIVKTVQTYKIALPVLQENGKSKSHLNIFINLSTLDAYASGQFFIKESDLLLGGVRYKIHNTAIRLHKNLLSVDTAKIQYQDIFASEVNGQLDLKDLKGDFYFDIEKIEFPLSETKNIKLSSKNRQIRLNFGTTTQSFIVPSTQWSFDDFKINAHKTEIFMQDKFSPVAKLKNIRLGIKDLIDFNTSGTYDVKEQYADVNIDVSKLMYTKDDINLSLKNLPIPVKMTSNTSETNLSLLSKNTLLFKNQNIDFEPTTFSFKDGYLDINKTKVSIQDIFSSEISTNYKLGSGNVKIQAENTTLFNDGLLYIQPSFELLYHYVQGLHYMDISKHGIHATLNKEKEFVLIIKDLSKLREHSKIMQRYDIKDGKAELTFIDERVGMDVFINNFYPLISQNGKDIKDYAIKGDYSNNVANIQINKNIDLVYRNKAKLTAKNIDFNLFPILDYLELIKTNDEKNDLELIVKTKKCNVSLGDSGRKILADSINMQIKENKISSQLIHNNGGVLFESIDHNMTVHGRGLNDTFMNSLFKFSTFKGGQLSFVMQGPFDDMEGIVNIQDAVLKDYTVINNTLAFFNTIPALITFSVPGYSKDGLNIKEMYGSYHKTGDIIKIKEAKISSKELTITARGQSDLAKENIEVLMEVKTDLGSTAKNIPILGYIIFGEDSVSTTVRVHGSLHDPKVENSVAKSIVVAPYNILKRTLSLPFKAFGLLDKDSKDENKSKN